MKKFILLLPAFILVLATSVSAQVTLDPAVAVNAQIAADTTADGSRTETTYLAEAGQYYYFDGTLETNFDLQILGPDGDTWIFDQEDPPVFFQFPAADGSARDMINLNEGGSVELRNAIFTGLLPNDVNISSIVRNFAGYKMIFDNNVFTDIRDHTTRSTGALEEFTVTNNLFINMDRRGGSPFGGMPFRIDAEVLELTFENNTLFNGARTFGNGGDFFTSEMTEIHNTLVNQQVNGHELHWFSAKQANNIYYNWSWRGRDLRTNGYEAPFTTFETHAGVKNNLDSVAIYQGFNAFYLDPAISNYWEDTINPMRADDSAHVRQSYLWNVDVDSTISADDNFTIGKNYWQLDPNFDVNPTKIDSMNGWNLANWTDATNYSDWRITPPITWNADGTPNKNWPIEMDLSYSNENLVGTDGLPLGDLNWFPDAKADYMANRDTYLAALEDSMTTATFVYEPGDSLSAFITMDNLPTSIESNNSNIPNKFYLSENYPNPFNPATTIKFGLPSQSKVTLSVFNVLGQKVFEFTEGSLSAGTHSVRFDASQLSSGMYIYRIQATDASGTNHISSKKMMLIK
ncbi:T9SS type A sorting domain-containing protein [Gracilimonas mengyeensis]|uniref:Por secretion system C-terminal sorting domain-containing protein n=1 Tax=Gracilimonas mengyeensis TaxID=1302730 RepID=A0A521C326_9BACT|nr:T9SS type A sorting domain-containing protein [Gracilimonas mengyeensis]SMO53852.1 Por secretion system C-terminal sorting domain-containing protein [Gracilimonas mengyeensis]